MKTLVIFYSRTGVTKKVANELAKNLNCDIEEIIDTKNRNGTLGYISAGKDATLKKLTKIEQIKNNPSEYDLIIIGTPIWSFTMATAIRTYIHENKDKFQKVAFFCTQGGSGAEKAYSHMQELCNKQPISTLTLLTKEVSEDNFIEKIKEFTDKIAN